MEQRGLVAFPISTVQVLHADMLRVGENPTHFAAAVQTLRVANLKLGQPSLAMLARRIWCRRASPEMHRYLQTALDQRASGKKIAAIGSRNLERARNCLLNVLTVGMTPVSNAVAAQSTVISLAPNATFSSGAGPPHL
ncbi:hypothetical protein J6524_35570 [Bradyrhizobium sp. WSM 1738]|uniref:hypothetical protein n=1 Tax=Bradyrhizobium hereditatis TaxID=2821405 RepID=UPI001CE3B45C|nr:hypothetical protein [Bradyrhizobium hereditatis]MCA6120124.1 hypothetical protein [Bradyrhizobium hereditatis]